MKEKTFLLCIPRHLNLRPTDAARIFPFFNLREEGNSTTVCKLTSRLRYEQQNGGKYFNTNNMIILLLRVRAEAGHNGSTLFGPTFQPTNRPTDQPTKIRSKTTMVPCLSKSFQWCHRTKSIGPITFFLHIYNAQPLLTYSRRSYILLSIYILP